VRTDLFDYVLPDELIASAPLAARDGGRMCVVGNGTLQHALVRDFPGELGPGDLLVLNDTKVRPARLYCRRSATVGQNDEGGKVELLFLERISVEAPDAQRWTALGRANRPLRPGDALTVGEIQLRVRAKQEGGLLEIDVPGDLDALLEHHGELPIPPYMRRAADERDQARYQTVFARHLGSAAAPTAGLHLTTELLGEVEARGARIERLTLHVGIGTFRPVVAADLDDHAMHSEAFDVSDGLADAVRQTRAAGGRVVAVGTTVVRALEAAADLEHPGEVRAMSGRTSLLIQPGYRFRVVDALLTNFHMPKSTLLALVSAFAGYERLFSAYRAAVDARYRFLSYGDAMWIPARSQEVAR